MYQQCIIMSTSAFLFSKFTITHINQRFVSRAEAISGKFSALLVNLVGTLSILFGGTQSQTDGKFMHIEVVMISIEPLMACVSRILTKYERSHDVIENTEQKM